MLNKMKKSGSIQSITSQSWFSPIIPLIVLFIALAVLTPETFLTKNNITNVMRQAAVYAIMAVGMTFPIITGGIDLSQGSVLAVVAITVGSILKNGEGSMLLAIIVGLAVGLLVGSINGFLIAFVGVFPFIVTLGTMNMMRGVALLLTNATPIDAQYPPFRVLGTGSTLGIPNPVYLFIIVAIIGQFILSKTGTGRYIFALGSNADAAKISGVKVRWNRIKAYMISGIAVAIAAILYVSRLGSAQPIAGDGYELEAVAATVIGGTSIVGGEGSCIGSVIGAVVVAIIRNGMVLLGVSTYWQQIVIGSVIVIAVSIDMFRKKIEERQIN